MNKHKRNKIIIIASVVFAVAVVFTVVISLVLSRPKIDLVYTGKIYPHNTESFTQGLFFDDEGNLYETGGNYGASKIYKEVDLNSGVATKEIKADSSVFLEGTTILDDKIYVLTWQEKIVYRYDKNLKLEKKYTIEREGWGLTTDGINLIASDGTANIFYYDPTFKLIKKVRVTDADGKTVLNINELEYINGYIFANIWMTDKIVVINPEDGKVIKTFEFPDLYPASKRANMEDVLNGIAYNKQTNRVYLTGKHWPYYFEFDLK